MLYGTIGISLFLVGCAIAVYATLFYHVNKYCTEAKNTYGGACADALIKLTQDESAQIRKRNDAIWALGQLADKKALSILKSMYKGVPDSREPLDKVISQYEIRKAMRWCSEGNWTSWMYMIIRE